MKLENLVISGAGTSGIGFLGILKYMEENNLLKNLNKLTGTSIGSIVCFLITINYSILELIEFCKYFDFSKIVSEGNLDNLINNFGFDNINKMYFIMIRMTQAKHIDPKITFMDHFKKTKKKLTITGTSLNEAKVYYFNYETYPNMQILLAIKISCCIPLVFQPISFNGILWIDGGISNNYPINYHHDEIEKTIGLCVFDKNLDCENKEMNDITQYLPILFKCFIYSDTNKNIHLYESNTIKFSFDLGCFSNFELSKNDIINLIETGYNYTLENKHKFNDFIDSDTENFSDTLNKTESDNIIKIVKNIEFQSDCEQITEDYDIYLTSDEDIETDILFLSDED
tara:strand:- start:2235 stop:3260 length:1026 start_codon:yes stop_codon:yes gene_type:complete